MSGKGPDVEVYSDFEHCSHFADIKFGYNDAPYHRPNSQALTRMSQNMTLWAIRCWGCDE